MLAVTITGDLVCAVIMGSVLVVGSILAAFLIPRSMKKSADEYTKWQKFRDSNTPPNSPPSPPPS